MEQPKRLPYGVSDFLSVRERNMYYVDKTMYLPTMENVADFLFFIRPRRFGKSLFISMMQAYYDKALSPRFDELFSDLWIGKHPTSTQGRYQVLFLDFSRINADIDTLEEDFNSYCCGRIEDFINAYEADYPAEAVRRVKAAAKASERLNIINDAARRLRLSLYLIIDEYDNFTNVMLNQQGEAVYHAMTHADGFYRGVFKLFKGMFERIFLTGVSPVTLDDLTSGFNIATNISTDPRLNDMLGFTTEDVSQMVSYYKSIGSLPAGRSVEDIINEMKPWYDNYCFAEDQLSSESRVFNPDMSLRYLNTYIGTGKPPRQMLDPNTKTDYKKMCQLLQLDTLSGERKGVLRRITEEGYVVAQITESFPAIRLTDPDMFVSLLFYYGMLTMQGTMGAELVLGIPNNNVRKQYYEYMLEQYQPATGIMQYELGQLFYEMAYNGKWEDALRKIGEAYKNTSSIRDAIQGERNIQGFFLAYLNLSSYYLTAPEMEVSHGFCDFFLMPDLSRYPSRHSYIIELKYLSKKDYELKAQGQWQQAVAQIEDYAKAPRVIQLSAGTQLHKVIMQFEGWELKRLEEV